MALMPAPMMTALAHSLVSETRPTGDCKRESGGQIAMPSETSVTPTS